MHRLGEHEAERRRDLCLAFAVEGARHEHGSLTGRRQLHAEGGLKRLVGLVLDRAQRLRRCPNRRRTYGTSASTGRSSRRLSSLEPLTRGLSCARASTTSAAMKSAAKSAKTAFRIGRGEKAAVGGWAASASESSEPDAGGADVELGQPLPDRGALRLDLRAQSFRPAARAPPGASPGRGSAVAARPGAAGRGTWWRRCSRSRPPPARCRRSRRC